MRVLIFTLLVLIAGLVSADDSYLCVAEKVTGFEFDKNSESWEIVTIPADQYRCHYVKAKVKVNLYDDGCMAVFHGPRKLSTYDKNGNFVKSQGTQAA